MFLGIIAPPSVSVVTKDDEDDAVHKSCEHKHTHIQSVHWFASDPPSDLPPVAPYGWEDAADIAIRARCNYLNGHVHLMKSVFSPPLNLLTP